PFKDNGQLYRGRQARESGLTENFPLGRRELLMGRSDFHNSEGCDKKPDDRNSSSTAIGYTGSVSASRQIGLAAMPKRFGRWPRSSAFRARGGDHQRLQSAAPRRAIAAHQGAIQ